MSLTEPGECSLPDGPSSPQTRRHPDQQPAAFRLRARLRVEEIAVDHERAVELAAATDLTAYDASYLWLAQELGAELGTLDRQLVKAEAAIRT